jgi:ribosomal protein L29
MKTKNTDLKNVLDKDLQKMLAEKNETLRGIRFGTTGTKLKNTKSTVNLKKEAARILTELRSRNVK